MDTHSDLLNLALRYHQSGALSSAERLYRQILETNPSSTILEAAANNLGIALFAQKQFAEAENWFRHVLRINANDADVHFNLGNVLMPLRRLDEAVACFEESLRLNPNHADALNHLGSALKGRGQIDQAIACYQQALRIRPQHADALNNLGVAHGDQGSIGPAIDCFREALRCNPRHADAHNNLGSAYLDRGLFTEAEECYRQSLASDPGHATARYNDGCLRLLRGDFAGGWPGYEHRWSQADMVPRSFPKERWDGSPLNGKTILVYAEQGLGDTLHFLRYLPMVKRRGGKVVLECQSALYKLLTGLPGVDQLVPVGNALPPFDVYIPLLSLAHVFRTTLTTVPAPAQLPAPDPNLIEYWRLELESLRGFKVGIAWQGNRKLKYDRQRSISLTHFEALAKVSGVQFISLQVGIGADQIQALGNRFPILNLGERLDKKGAFLDTVAVMKCLDLVVSVDSALAHLAGTLGVPVWLPLALVPNWRWLLAGTDCPWYPSMRLFRQRNQGVWDDVFERMAHEVRALSANPGSANRG
jgi:tetratricopeptide (TPR) repeat protein